MALSWENLELLVKGLGFAITAVTLIAGWLGSEARMLSRLKLDLEILKLIPEGHPSRPAIDRRVARAAEILYGDPEPTAWFWIMLTTSFVQFAGFSWWSWSLLTDAEGRFVWNSWVLLTGYIALMGLSMVGYGLFNHTTLTARTPKGGNGTDRPD